VADDGALVEPLALDIQPALDALEPLGEKLAELSTGFAESLSDALASIGEVNTVSVGADTTELDAGIADALDQPRPPIAVDADTDTLTDTITTAVADAPVDPIVVDGDTEPLDSAIQDTVGQEIPPLTITGDTSELTDAIDQATQGGEATVAVNADATELQNAIDDLTVNPIEVPVELDTGEAQDQLDGLGESASNAIGSEGKGVLGLASAVGGLEEVAPLAEGETQGLVASIAGLQPETALAAGGIVALGGFIGEATSQAASAEAQNKRFAGTFGDLKEQIEQVNVGGLSISLKDLGEQSATSNTKLESSASRIGEMGRSAGATDPALVKATQGVLALSAAASVTNPELGDTADVADRLSRLLQTGGPRLAQYGISLSSAAIRAEALKENIGKTASELTPFDKLVAGTTLALQQQGDTLGTKFATGARNAQIELRALKVELEESVSAIGGPLLQPLVTSMQSLLPVAVAVGSVLGNLGRIALPFLEALGPGLVPVAGALNLISVGLGGVADVVGEIPTPVLAIASALGILTAVALGAADSLIAATLAMGPVGIAAIGIAAGLAIVGFAMREIDKDSKSTVESTTDLDAALNSTATTADGLAGSLNHLAGPLEDFLKKQLALGPAGQSGADAAA
jgi:hypothetical protein